MKLRATSLDAVCWKCAPHSGQIQRPQSSPTSFYTLGSIVEGFSLQKAPLSGFAVAVMDIDKRRGGIHIVGGAFGELIRRRWCVREVKSGRYLTVALKSRIFVVPQSIREGITNHDIL